jgi:hypothetical protein
MIACAVDAGAPARWVAADEVYAADPGLRTDLEACQVSYVLAIGCDRACLPQLARCVPTPWPPACSRVLVAVFGWSGARGQRYYAWT